MTKDEVIQRLRESNRAEVHRATGLPYRYLRNLVDGDIDNPGSMQMDTLRNYFSQQDQPASPEGRAAA